MLERDGILEALFKASVEASKKGSRWLLMRVYRFRVYESSILTMLS